MEPREQGEAGDEPEGTGGDEERQTMDSEQSDTTEPKDVDDTAAGVRGEGDGETVTETEAKEAEAEANAEEGTATETEMDGEAEEATVAEVEKKAEKETTANVEEGTEQATVAEVEVEPVPVDLPEEGFVEPDVSAVATEPAFQRNADEGVGEPREDVPEEVRKYDRFKKVDRAEYDRVNDFIRKRTYITAREWAIARLCSDFRTETGVEMTLIGENLQRLVPFMEDTYTPQAVNQARSAFEDKVRMSGSTFLYGAMSGFFTTEELDEMMYEVSETARFLLEVEGVEIGVEHETEVQDRISSAMRDIRESSRELRGEEDDEVHRCPECGHEF